MTKRMVIMLIFAALLFGGIFGGGGRLGKEG